MRYYLENEALKIEVESLGAELKGVHNKVTGQDYMWYADSKFWGRTSPVLFPFVGGLRNKQYTYNGKNYSMGQHGFARDMEFTLVKESDHALWFELKSTEETVAKYPFAFELQIGYVLHEDVVKVVWKVKNPGQEAMEVSDQPLYFSIGAHPAFLCPIHGEENKAGYRLFFEGVDVIRHRGNANDAGLAEHEDLKLELTDHRAVITPDFFDRCTYIIEGNQTKCVGLEDSDGRRYVTMEFDMPLFAIWSPEGKNAPFLCIEPWCGRCDAVDYEGTLENREFGNVLEKDEVFKTSYTMKFE